MTREEVAKEMHKLWAYNIGSIADSFLPVADWHLEQLRKRTEECARIYDTHTPAYQHIERVKDAILALNEPPKPPAPFGCKCWTWKEERDAKAWIRNHEAVGAVFLRDDAQFCEVCGRAKQ